MAILTAKQWKSRETPEFPIDLGDGLEVMVRRPDVQLMVLQGLLPTPLFNEVIKIIGEWVGSGLNELTESIIKSSDKVLTFVNAFVCAALVSPRVVMSEEDRLELAPGDRENALLITDLTIATRKKIVVEITLEMQRSSKAVVAAAAEFPEGESGEGTGSDVPPIPVAALVGD